MARRAPPPAVVFSSPLFLFAFLPAVLAVYFASGRRARNAVLLLASLLFYAWGEPRVVFVMLASIAANFGLGLWVESRRRPSAAMAVALLFNLGLLVVFKYANWIWASLGGLYGALGGAAGTWPVLEPIPLPIGISFFTFQALSYVVDVHRRDGPAQRNPLDFAVYIALFPQLIAGPIVRYHDIAAQLVQRREGWALFCSGVRRFTIGLGKKVLVANVVAGPADGVFALAPAELPASVAWLGIACYTLQIYFDFSGYSDMAIGLGRMFGFEFLENFEHPYVSRSITEFWRRWHISLSSWFRDYLYIPLGGSRRGTARTYRNLMLVFLLCGLWHGAAWNFLVWGAFHGAFLVLERVLPAGARPLPRPLRHAYVMAVVVFGWVLFRAPDLASATTYARALLGLGSADAGLYEVATFLQPSVALALAAGAVGSTPWWPSLRGWMRAREASGRGLATVGGLELAGTLWLTAVLAVSVVWLSSGTYNPFIYFRF